MQFEISFDNPVAKTRKPPSRFAAFMKEKESQPIVEHPEKQDATTQNTENKGSILLCC